ncbi:MAG: hypothetical protein A2Y33_03480 [Spirochaetes bacterium GWF1_51_8]|nr:MAG: hypothetical protein A2Y33_03480 [Spirochaetes bacterium GWF1_51_8]
MRLNVIHIYFFLFLLIVVARGIFMFPLLPQNQDPMTTNGIVLTNTLITNTMAANGIPVEPPDPRYIYSWAEYIPIIIFDLIALIGIFCLGAKKELFVPIFWKIFLVLFFLIEAYVIYRSAWNSKFWTFLWSLAMILPAPYAIWGYAFGFRWVEYEKRRKEHDAN